ncbi:MAG: TetR/AcrR family transcriptional regulator [Treponemataceae bacterium]
MNEKTREKIIKATLSLYTDSALDDISLSRIVKTIGVTKACIYRHFSSKEDLLFCVEQYFFDKLYDFFSQFNYISNDNKDTAQIIFMFFLKNQDLLCYAIYRLCVAESFEKDIYVALKERGVSLIMGDNDYSVYLHDDFFKKKYLQFLYNLFTSSTLLLESKKSLSNVDTDILCNRVVDFVFHGWWMLKDIPPHRRSELQFKAEVVSKEIPVRDKVYDALAALIKEKGFTGVTVDLLAQKLCLARSSLYSYFTKKDEALVNLVVQEIAVIESLLLKRFADLDDLSEMVYVHIFTVLSYLQSNPSSIHICSLLRAMGLNLWSIFREKDLFHQDKNNQDVLYKNISIPDFGYKLSLESFTLWITTLPITVLVQGHLHNFTPSDLRKSLDITYDIMRDGLKSSNAAYEE